MNMWKVTWGPDWSAARSYHRDLDSALREAEYLAKIPGINPGLVLLWARTGPRSWRLQPGDAHRGFRVDTDTVA
jgi:hypothetical protein